MSWPTATLGEITEKIGSGSTPRGGGESYKSYGIPFVRSMNVRDGEFVVEGLAYLDEPQAAALKHVTLHAGDVLLNITGASVARVCRLPDQLSGGRVNQHVSIIRPDKKRLDTNFLAHLLRAPQAKSRLLRVAGAGATREAITKAQIEEFKIPLPSLSEQRRIAAILDKADALRRKRNHTLDLLDGLSKSIFQEMFSASNLTRRPIGSVCEVGSGSTPRREDASNFGGEICWVKTTEVRGDSINDTEERVTEKGFKNARLRLYPRGTVLIAMYGQGATRGKVGILGVDASTNQACAALLAGPEMHPVFLFHQLRQSYDKLRELGRGGNQPNLNGELVKKFEVVVPPRAEQDKFVNLMQQMSDQADLMKSSSAALEDVFSSLQARAFSGQL